MGTRNSEDFSAGRGQPNSQHLGGTNYSQNNTLGTVHGREHEGSSNRTHPKPILKNRLEVLDDEDELSERPVRAVQQNQPSNGTYGTSSWKNTKVAPQNESDDEDEGQVLNFKPEIARKPEVTPAPQSKPPTSTKAKAAPTKTEAARTPKQKQTDKPEPSSQRNNSTLGAPVSKNIAGRLEKKNKV